jgi:hypothetical protein
MRRRRTRSTNPANGRNGAKVTAACIPQPPPALLRSGLRAGERAWLVDFFGLQYNDLRVERTITANVADEPMTAPEARQLATALLDAAEGLDRLTGTAPPL